MAFKFAAVACATVTAEEIETGCVNCQNVPLTGSGFEELTPTRLPEEMMPISVADVGAVLPVVPTDGFVALIEPVIGRGLDEETPTKLPLTLNPM